MTQTSMTSFTESARKATPKGKILALLVWVRLRAYHAILDLMGDQDDMITSAVAGRVVVTLAYLAPLTAAVVTLSSELGILECVAIASFALGIWRWVGPV